MLIIGERINPSGKRALGEDLARGKFEVLLAEGERQIAAGAQALDVNVFVEGCDEAQLMAQAIEKLRGLTARELFIDSRSASVHRRILEQGGENLVVNSIREEPDPAALLALAAARGAGAVLLAVGTPTGAVESRKAAARALAKQAQAAGLDRDRLWFDVAVVPIALGAVKQAETFEFLRFVRDELGSLTLAAVSNGSFGLTSRTRRNRDLLEQLAREGVDAVILDPTQPGLLDVLQQGV